jgi:hypothetical protein
MLRGLLVELSPHERRTLLRIANGNDSSGTHNPADVKRLQLLAHLSRSAMSLFDPLPRKPFKRPMRGALRVRFGRKALGG